MADLTDEMTFKFFSWIRFVEFTGDMMILVQAKIKDEKLNKNKDDEELDSDDEGPVQKSYKAENINVISIQNEKQVMNRLKQLCSDALKQYPHSLQEDIAILKKDDTEHNLTFNQRNCVLFRSGEKEILHFYIEFSDYITTLLGMKFKDAKKETQILPKQFE